MAQSLRSLFPFRLFIGQEDCTFLLDDGGTFSSVDPGGFEAASFSIPRDMPQTLRGQYVRLDAGLHVAWEGRVSQIQRSLGHRTQIMCEGYGALLKDNAASMVFVDRALTRWQQASVQRQINLTAANEAPSTPQVSADPTSGNPSLAFIINDSWVAPNIPVSEGWYDAGPSNLIGRIYLDNVSSLPGANWTMASFVSSDANATTTINFGSSILNNDATGAAYFTPGSQYRFAFLQLAPNATPGGAQGAQFAAYQRKLAVYGTHGLTGRGSDPQGLYPSDIFGWTVGQVPGLQAGTVQQTDASNFIVPHSVYYTPVTLDQIAGDMSTIQGWHWGVWESLAPLTGNTIPRADFRPRPQPGAFTAFFHREACDTLDIREDLSQQYNGAIANFTNVDGTLGTVTVTADNPVLDQAGIASRTLVLQGGTMTPATAAVFAAESLAITNIQARVAGSADVISAIDGPSGPTAAFLLKPGIDRVRIGDAPSVDAFGAQSDFPLTRMECSLSSSGITTSLELGSGANLVETLNARLAAATALAGNGGV